ncbi:hypothetical protein ACP8HI_20885 [Paenibacillus sp. FA6]|uniref:hypothetical protein n=1 Tax=Paenibacillus sp. FA6 TaxID=3413029 RepID=UPI003F65597D
MTDALNRVKLSQWDALLIESLRAFGWSDEELLRRVAEGDLPLDESEYEFDYKQLAALSVEKPEEFERAVRQGYQIKYSTIRGIRSWISIALRKEAVLELEEGQESVEVALTVTEKSRLESVLSFGWEIHTEPQATEGENVIYRIEPIQR